jgi:sulfoxide reductase heme-binding subunit YedZ
VLGFAAVHAQFSPMHRWNRAFGDASLVLVALSMAFGPLTRFLRAAVPLLPFRREMGIHGLPSGARPCGDHSRRLGRMGSDAALRVRMASRPPGLCHVPAWLSGLPTPSGSRPWSSRSCLPQRRAISRCAVWALSGWKFLQMGVLPMWWLTVAHVAYFLFMHFLSFHRATPPPNPLQPWFVGLVVVVLGLRAAAYLKTIRAKAPVRTARTRGGQAMRRSERDLAQAAKKTTRRSLLLGGAMTSVVGVLGFRMWQLGVRDAEQYYLLAEENRISLRLVRPDRGRILDRAGKIVADNEHRPTASRW